MESDDSSEASSSTDNKQATTEHPKMISMITEALRSCTERKGASYVYIRNYINGKYPSADGPRFKNNFKKALMTGVEKNVVVRTKATEAAKGLMGRFILANVTKSRVKTSAPASSELERPGPSKAAPRKIKKSVTAAGGGGIKDSAPGKPVGVQRKRAAGADTKSTSGGPTDKNDRAGKKPMTSRAVNKEKKGTDAAPKVRKGSNAAAKTEKGNAAAVKEIKENAEAAKEEGDNYIDVEETITDVEHRSDSEHSAVENEGERENFAANEQIAEDPRDEARRQSESEVAEETTQQNEGEESDTETERCAQSENTVMHTVDVMEASKGLGKNIGCRTSELLSKTAEYDMVCHEDSSGVGEPDCSKFVASGTPVPGQAVGPTGDAFERNGALKAGKQRSKPARRAKK